MRLKQLELTNMCQHRSLKWYLEPGLIGIFGRNGVGKSNALMIGSYANLTGDFRVAKKAKEKLVRRTAPEGSKAISRSIWVHGDREFEITREIGGPNQRNRQFLKEGENKAITKDDEIMAKVLEILQVPESMLHNYWFVPQWGIFDCLIGTFAKRAQDFAELCGTTKAEQCWELLGKQALKDAALVPHIEDVSGELKDKIRKAKLAIRAAKAEAKQHRNKRLSKEEFERTLRQVQQRTKYLELVNRWKGTKERREEAEREHATSLSLTKKLQQNLETSQAALTELTAAAEEAKVRSSNHRLNNEAYLTRVRIETQLKGCTEPPAPTVPKVTCDLEALEKTRRDLDAEIDRLQSLLDHAKRHGVGECEACGSEITAEVLTEKVSQWQERLAVATAERITVKEQWKQGRDSQRAWTAYESELASYRKDHAALTRQLESFAGFQPPEPPREGDEQLVRDAKEAADKHKRLNDQYQQEKGKLAGLATSLDRLKGREAADLAGARAVKISKGETESSRAMLRAHREATAILKPLGKDIVRHREDLESATAQLQSLREAQARAEKAKQWLGVLQQSRDWMHRNSFPEMVHASSLQLMVGEINDTLRMFGGPFFVKDAQSIDLKLQMADGEETPEGLSGGQLVVLALAFRLAVAKFFGGGLGMLILDEPTAGLDIDNVSYLRAALQSLSKQAKRDNTQIIMVTHDDRLVSAFDQVIRMEDS